jgi:hypothetical protein
MRAAALLRERLVLPVSIQLRERMSLLVASYYPDEIEVMHTLNRRGSEDLALEIAQFLMEKLGHEAPAVKDPRFDKTRRALNKKRPKGPRGGNGVQL